MFNNYAFPLPSLLNLFDFFAPNNMKEILSASNHSWTHNKKNIHYDLFQRFSPLPHELKINLTSTFIAVIPSPGTMRWKKFCSINLHFFSLNGFDLNTQKWAPELWLVVQSCLLTFVRSSLALVFREWEPHVCIWNRIWGNTGESKTVLLRDLQIRMHPLANLRAAAGPWPTYPKPGNSGHSVKQ